MIIEVYDSPKHEKLIITFDNAADFVNYVDNVEPDMYADRVVIDDMVMLGWDEIEELIG